MSKSIERITELIEMGNTWDVTVGLAIVESLERIADALEKQNAGNIAKLECDDLGIGESKAAKAHSDNLITENKRKGNVQFLR